MTICRVTIPGRRRAAGTRAAAFAFVSSVSRHLPDLLFVANWALHPAAVHVECSAGSARCVPPPWSLHTPVMLLLESFIVHPGVEHILISAIVFSLYLVMIPAAVFHVDLTDHNGFVVNRRPGGLGLGQNFSERGRPGRRNRTRTIRGRHHPGNKLCSLRRGARGNVDTTYAEKAITYSGWPNRRGGGVHVLFSQGGTGGYQDLWVFGRDNRGHVTHHSRSKTKIPYSDRHE